MLDGMKLDDLQKHLGLPIKAVGLSDLAHELSN